MVNLLIATDPRNAPSVQFYRTVGPCSQLPEEINVTVKTQNELLQLEQWAWGRFQAILIERPHTPEGHTLIHIAKTYGVKVWLDIDDDLVNIPIWNEASTQWAHPKAQERIMAAFQAADLLTVSTPALLKLYGGANKNIACIPNAFNDAVFTPAPIQPQGRPVKMAWRGSGKHSGDIEEVKRPLLKAYADTGMRWKFYGAQPPAWLPFQHGEYRKFSPLYDYFLQLAADAPDWLFVPLMNILFNHAKSKCAAIEQFMLSGGAVIAPHGLPEFNMPGVLRYRDNADLTNIFADIAKGKVTKEEYAQAGQEHIKTHLSLSALNVQRSALLKQMAGYYREVLG